MWMPNSIRTANEARKSIKRPSSRVIEETSSLVRDIV